MSTCGYECAETEPYGFVPEAGCPVHDSEVQYAPGVEPLVPGRRYRFEDFAGGTWEATFRSVSRAGTHWRLTFDDHAAFETNLPVSWERAEGQPE